MPERTMKIALASMFVSLATGVAGLAQDGEATALEKAMAAATGMAVFEGLPHAAFQKQTLEKEWLRKDIFRSNGYFFYAAPLALNETAKKALERVFARREALPPYSGAKLGAGFHPDYMVAWTTPEGDFCVQVCFTCHEARLFGPGVFLQTDLWGPARENLKRVLTPFARSVHAEGPELNAWDLTAKDLIAASPIIAVIDINHSAKPLPGEEDLALDFPVLKHRARALSRKVLKGSLPAAFMLENEDDSVLSEGEHLAFIRQLDARRYVLSTAVSLRRIKDGQVYWFPHIYKPLDEVIAEITSAEAKNK